MHYTFIQKTFSLVLLVGVSFFLMVLTVQAQEVYLPTQNDIGISDKPVFEVVGDVTKFLATLIGVLAILVIVVAGIMYITSGGDSGRVESAKGMLTYAIIGLVIALLAWVIVVTLSGALGAGPAGPGLPPGDPCIYSPDPDCI